MNILTLTEALELSIVHIQEKLDLKIYGITRVTKIYGSNSNSFYVYTIDENKNKKAYFLKFGDNQSIRNEYEHSITLSEYIHVPKMILVYFNMELNINWILFAYKKGKLFSEIVYSFEQSDPQIILQYEEKKESQLVQMYQKTLTIITYEDYINLRSNNLFYRRLHGDRYKEFYSSETFITSFWNKNIYLNGKKLEYNFDKIFTLIKEKYNSFSKDSEMPAVLGHGDAHHGNIMICNNNIVFIDTEYSGITPIYMELAKAYYNDFVGEYFFHYQKKLLKCFKHFSYSVSENRLEVELEISSLLDLRFALTKIKCEKRKDVFQDKTDFLSLNDYLFLCHTLNKNPNFYLKNVQVLFIVIGILIYTSDPFNPEDLKKLLSAF